MEYSEYLISAYEHISECYLIQPGLQRMYSQELGNFVKRIPRIISPHQILISFADFSRAVLLDLESSTVSFLCVISDLICRFPISIASFKYLKNYQHLCSVNFSRYVTSSVYYPQHIVCRYLFRDRELVHQFRIRKKLPSSSHFGPPNYAAAGASGFSPGEEPPLPPFLTKLFYGCYNTSWR